MTAHKSPPKRTSAALVIEKAPAHVISSSQDLTPKRWVPLNEAARVVQLSSKTLRLDVNANLIPSRRTAKRGGIEVDLDAAIDKYAGGAPLASRLFVAFGEGRSPVEMVIETGLDPVLVKRMWQGYIELSRDPHALQAKKTCPDCGRTDGERAMYSKEFAGRCAATAVDNVRCCMRCYTPREWQEKDRNS